MTETPELREQIAAIFAEDDDFVGIGDSSYEKADRVLALARPAPDEGAVKPLEWDDRNRAQGYRVQPTYGQDRKPYILTRDGSIIWAYDTVEDAKAEAQADWERRIRAALSSPEDATPAAPVSVEEAYREGHTDGVLAGSTDIEEQDWDMSNARASLTQQDRRAALREMQSIREEIEQESGA